MNEPLPTAPAPPPPRSGCLAKGCFTLVILFLFLGVAFIGGGYWALRHLQNTYSDTKPLTFGNVTSYEPVAVQEPPSPAPFTAGEPTPPSGPSSIPPQPRPTTAAQPSGDVRARWQAFEKAGKRGEPANIELTANDINSLLASNPKLSGKAFVSIANDSARVRVSVPLDKVFMMKGRYLNGEATVESSPDGDPHKARISNVVLGSQAVPESVLDRRMFGLSSIRGYMTDWLDQTHVSSFAIQNDRVIGATGGSR